MALRGAEQPSYEFIITLLGVAAAADEAIKFYQVLFYIMLI
jgi:hypothetical protein